MQQKMYFLLIKDFKEYLSGGSHMNGVLTSFKVSRVE